MRVCDWMTPEPVAVRLMSTIREARQLLTHHHVRHLPVLDGGRVVGMLRDADVGLEEPIGLSGPSEVHGVLGSGRTVSSVLTGPACVVSAEADVDTAARLLLAYGVGALAVVDRGRHLVGVITTGDCLRALMSGQPVPG
jgi:acetoin utilization protein AcuB